MRAKKVDANQLEIIKALQSVGAVVCDLSRVGFGCPDLLVSFCGKNYLLEVKNPAGFRFTPDQKEFYEKWKAPISIVKTKDEALKAIGIII